MAYKVDADNELCFASSSSLDFDRIVSICILRCSHAPASRRNGSSILWWSILRWSACLRWSTHSRSSRVSRRITRSSCVDRRRSAHHLGRRCTRSASHGTLRTADGSWCGRVVVGIARWSPTSTWVVHRETCC
jgi:hypothetical protein